MNDDSSTKSNGTHGGTAYNENAKAHPDSLTDVVSAALGGAIFEMQTGLFNLGRNRALQSGTAKPREEDIVALTEHATAMARQTYRDKYDPSQNVHDAMHETEYRRDIAGREESENAGRHAAANLRDAEIKLARTPKAGPKPSAHPSLIAAFIVAIMLSVAPTLHDSIFITIGDDLLNWFGSILSAAFVGVMLTLAILSGRRTKWTWVGVAAGVILGLGLWAVRLSGATGAGEAMVATGLTIIEIAAVGQQATALLTVLLNQHGAPLIIDQPEDDVDSKMSPEIVRQIWTAKSRRQLIFASHNANFVVNGDAELIICCDYVKAGDQTGGQIKATGAIDSSNIKDEITAVTEGGKEAFKLRKEKYGF